MKILQVINAYYPPYISGGAAFVAHNISKALAKRGNEVTVYTTNALSKDRLFAPLQNPTYNDGVRIHYFKNTIYEPSIQIYFSRELVEGFKKNVAKYDVVHSHEYRSYIGILTSHYAQKYGVPIVLQAHGQLPRIMAKPGLKLIYDYLYGYKSLRNASKVIALNQTEAEQYKSMGVPEEKVAVIPNGIDLSEFVDLPAKGSFKKKFGLGDDEKIVLFLGRIHRIKGIDILVKAFANVVKTLDTIRLVIGGPDDGYLGKVKDLITTFRIEDKVLITGPLYGREKLEAYVDAEVYVLPSRYEVFGMTVIESVACGTPSILTNNCGIAKYFKEPIGIVVPPTHKKIEEALLNVLKNDALRDAFISNCIDQRSLFDISKTVRTLEKVYDDIVNTPR
jgi:glycosyltransferase involved in cell wall biosynthesis